MKIDLHIHTRTGSDGNLPSEALFHETKKRNIDLMSVNGHDFMNIIEEYMLEYIDGVECWHSRLNAKTTGHYIAFAKKHGLFMTGGSDCHQRPLMLGTLDIPDWVAEQFRRQKTGVR
ncbi:hypothetical protein ACFLT4_03335 [Chloroflexota bacterium]